MPVLTVEGDLVDLEDCHIVGEVRGVPSGVDESLTGGCLEVAFLTRVPDFVGSDDNVELAESVGAVSGGQNVFVGCWK